MASSSSNKKYVKMDPREHVLARPGMYIGSVEIDKTSMWVLNENKTEMMKKEVDYIPGLFKIFDEILVNVLDHIIRLKSETGTVKHVKEVSVNITPTSISVYNDGEGVDIYKHEVHGVYIPELVFGNMLTSTNYDDTTERVIGGQNGIGAKACNIYSKSFEIETVDSKRKLLYKQKFSKNMFDKSEPEVTKYTKYPYTRITFEPDFEKFKIKELSPDMINLYMKRVYDVNSISNGNIKVNLNGEKLKASTFEKYVDMFIGSKSEHPRVSDVTSHERWKIAATYSDDGFQQVSFVNGISTIRGGKHVEYITNQITKKLSEMINKKKKANVKQQHIKEYLFVFVESTVVNPTFDSQSKETLTTPISKFGSKFEVDDKFIEKLYKTGIVDKAINISSLTDDKNSKKTDGKKRNTLRGIAKLDDANWAGTSKSKECTLILTEGDSAKTMAISGLSEVGRNKYGVFPLRGKVMNVKDMTQKRINENEEIANIKKILGLESNKEYKDVSELRYGKIMIMTDSDVDGSHIKGLLFNVFQSMWPTLIKYDGFLNSMLTPIVKVKKGKIVKEFYCLTDYENWKKDLPNHQGWEIKYYKGLGTSTNKEAKEYFKHMKYVTYKYDTTLSDESIDMAFNKKRSDDRKQWIYNYDRNDILDFGKQDVEYSDFINKELIHFSVYNLERSIPSICDGLKKSLRKILFCCFKRKLHKEVKVAQLAGYVSEHGAYHHGEVSLQDAIVGMAQDFVGSNNINLLCPNGQFGTRIQGGKDSASPRYIHTQLNLPIVYTLFHQDDQDILNYLEDDGLKIEPEHYLPILPLILINGTSGIGTGFSTNIPCYNPKDIIHNIKLLLEDENADLKEMLPWYRNFTGTIDDGVSYGKYSRKDNTKIEVSELPIGIWTEDFKTHLESYIDKNPKILKDYESHYTEKNVSFILIFYSKEITDDMFEIKDGQSLTKFQQEFKMTNSRPLMTSNMHLYTSDGKIKKYENVLEILREFYTVRLEAYKDRKKNLIDKITKEILHMDSRIKFILDVIEERLKLMNAKKSFIQEYLESNNFPRQEDSYDYLIKMPIYNFTYEKKEELIKELKNKKDMLAQLESTDEKTMWLNDIKAFEDIYAKM
jgi:DNA topoisomerase-2